MIKKLAHVWHGETSGLTTAALIVGAASLASRLVGVLRDRALAATFGAGPQLDAYYAAFRVPDFLYNLIILGALTAGFVPVFCNYLETKERREAWQLAEMVFSVVAVTMALGCLALALFADKLIPLTVPGFSPEQIAITVHISRIMFLSPFFLGLSAVMGGILQAERRYFAFSLAPVLYNVGIMIGVLVFSRWIGLAGVAWGVVLGAFLHFIAQASVALRLGFERIPWPSLRHAGVRQILKLMAPRSAGLAVSQFNLIILLALASSLSAGSVSVFNLAMNLQSFPVSIFGISYAVAAFPLLSRLAIPAEKGEFSAALAKTTRQILFLILPATAAFFLLRAQIVRLVLGSGSFDWNDTIRTATVLGFLLLSLVFQALVPLYTRAFYALQNTWTPLLISVVSEVVNIGSAFLLRSRLGISGLAFAFSISSLVNFLLLVFFLRRSGIRYTGYGIARAFLITFAASLAFFSAGYPVRQLLGTIFQLRTFPEVLLQATGAICAGGGAFILVAWLLQSPELLEFTDKLNRKLFKRAPNVSGADEAQDVAA